MCERIFLDLEITEGETVETENDMVLLTMLLLMGEREGWSVQQKKFTYKSKKKLIFTSTKTKTMPRVEVKVSLEWIG